MVRFLMKKNSIYLKIVILIFMVVNVCNFLCMKTFCESRELIEASTNVNGELEFESKAVILMEASSGKILYEKDADLVVSPASITKIMTLIIIFDKLDEGKIALEDVVTTSEYAKSMGGSQVFLETGEQQTVETLIKCIVVASGNDASVCMAEYIAGSEEAFVDMMNIRAEELGMENTFFLDCCGLNDTMEHHTSARDVAIMSRELITKYPMIFEYSKIWMENIVHKTNQGEKEFTLANTNKLLKQYEWATGLKTGSTSLAKYCLSATAKKDDIELIAVVMGAPNYKVRFSEAKKLLEHGFLNVSLYKSDNSDLKQNIEVENGKKGRINIEVDGDFSYVCMENENIDEIERKVEYYKLIAPIKKGEKAGIIEYYIGNKKIGENYIKTIENVEKLSYIDYLKKMWYKYMI